MKPPTLAAVVALSTVVAAQPPRLTLDHAAMARQIVVQLALERGERVMSIGHPGTFEALVPHLRYEVMRAGGIDLGAMMVLAEPWPESFDAAGIAAGGREARAHYKEMFRNVDAAIMLPGASTAHPAYAAMVDLLKDDLQEKRGRRTIHFHWVEGNSAYALPGQPLPPRFAIDAVYQEALLHTDYPALARAQRELVERLRRGEVRLTSPGGTNLRFRVGDRPFNLQDGDASRRRSREARVLIDKEIELPAGAVRVAPIEESVEGVIAFPPSQWNGRPVEGLKLRFARGRVVEVTAASGKEAVDAEMRQAGDAGRSFREFAFGLNPRLAVPERAPWIPYYGYGTNVVRLSLGDNSELGGTVTGGYVRWNFFTDIRIE